jgi:hypothetical protein
LNKGRPVVLEAGVKLADAYKAVAADLGGILREEPEEAPKGTSIFGRLTKRR